RLRLRRWHQQDQLSQAIDSCTPVHEPTTVHSEPLNLFTELSALEGKAFCLHGRLGRTGRSWCSHPSGRFSGGNRPTPSLSESAQPAVGELFDETLQRRYVRCVLQQQPTDLVGWGGGGPARNRRWHALSTQIDQVAG